MNPTLTFADADVLSSSALSYALSYPRELPAYYELSIEDDHSNQAHWVISVPLKQLAKRSVLLWQLPAASLLSPLACAEAGTMHLASAHLGGTTNLRTELQHGLLRLNFSGQVLRGYYRLQRLPAGNGQLWQLTPIGHI
jgi:hypothetical protein